VFVRITSRVMLKGCITMRKSERASTEAAGQRRGEQTGNRGEYRIQTEHIITPSFLSLSRAPWRKSRDTSSFSSNHWMTNGSNHLWGIRITKEITFCSVCRRACVRVCVCACVGVCVCVCLSVCAWGLLTQGTQALCS